MQGGKRGGEGEGTGIRIRRILRMRMKREVGGSLVLTSSRLWGGPVLSGVH